MNRTRGYFCAALLMVWIAQVHADDPTAQDPGTLSRDVEKGLKHLAKIELLPHDGSQAREATPVEKALGEPVKWEFVETPLSDVMDHLRATYKINVVADTKALEESGTATDTVITFSVHGITMRSALGHLLANLDLTFIYDDRVLTITTPEKASNHTVTEVYDVHDLLDVGGHDTLIKTIVKTVGPTTWDEVGGPGSIKEHARSIAISQTQEVHEHIRHLFAALREARAAKNSTKRVWAESQASRQALEKLEEELRKPVTWQLVETPVADLLDKIRGEHALPVLADRKGLEEAGVGTDRPLTVNVSSVPLATAIDLTLKRIDLTTFPSNEALIVSTPEKEGNALIDGVYPIADLAPRALKNKSESPDEADDDALLDLITTIVAPTTWDEVGGPGMLERFGDVLVIGQTYRIHRQIKELLAQLRANSAAQPMAETKERTEPARSPSELVLRIYALRPVYVETVRGASGGGGGGGRGDGGGFFQTAGGQPSQKPANPPADPAKLIQPATDPKLAAELADTIKSLIEPNSWNRAGAYIRPAAGNLIVRQTTDVHNEIAKLLNRLGVYGGQK